MKSYEFSAATLKMILSHPSLQRDKIDVTMEALAVANEDAREIDQMIRDGGVIASGTETLEADVEADLSALVKEIETEEAAKATEAKKVEDLLLHLQVPQDRPREETPEQGQEAKMASPIM